MNSSIILLPFFFFFNDTATTEIYTLSLHDALPICERAHDRRAVELFELMQLAAVDDAAQHVADRKSTRLNSSHSSISYAVFCLKKKTKQLILLLLLKKKKNKK